MADLKVQEQKRIDAENFRLLASVINNVVPKVLETFDGKVLNVRFINELNKVSTELYGEYLGYNERKYPLFEFSFSSTNPSKEKDEEGKPYIERELEIMSREMVRKYGYNYYYSSVKFVIFAKDGVSCRIDKDMSNKEFGRGWYLPAYKDVMRLMENKAKELDACGADKVDECKDKLKRISKLIAEEFGGMDKVDRGALSRYDKFNFSDIIGMKEAFEEVKKEWYNSEDLKALYEFSYFLRH